MISVELSEATIKKLFKMASSEIPSTIGDFEVSNALDKIGKTISSLTASAVADTKKSMGQNAQVHFSPEAGNNNILIVDDIGVVTYQLKVLFEKHGFSVETAKDIYTAVNHFKKNCFSYIIMDLFVSTEREGFILLDEVKKIINRDGLDTKVIVITASGKAEHKLKCLNKGADKFMSKEQGWQEEILSICMGKEEEESEEESEV
ncbi:response regulator [bacterium]|nr:response regulator [bacterium]